MKLEIRCQKQFVSLFQFTIAFANRQEFLFLFTLTPPPPLEILGFMNISTVGVYHGDHWGRSW